MIRVSVLEELARRLPVDQRHDDIADSVAEGSLLDPIGRDRPSRRTGPQSQDANLPALAAQMTDQHDHAAHGDEHHGHHHTVSYDEAIRGFRADKDEYFRTGARSPIPEAQRAGFEGLPYFDVDEGLRFEGLPLEPYAGTEPSSFAIPTSDGKLRPAVRAGTLRFRLDGVDHRLSAYTFQNQPDDGSVFVPVLDATSGHETYGAGRYLDLEREEDGTYALDFNLLYHPSCVYDPKFSCPLTPAENRLPIRIEAGERLAEETSTG